MAQPPDAAPRAVTDSLPIESIESTGIFTDSEPLMKVEGGQLVFKTAQAGEPNCMAAPPVGGGPRGGMGPLPPATSTIRQSAGEGDLRGQLHAAGGPNVQ
jgi:hypothetical protein